MRSQLSALVFVNLPTLSAMSADSARLPSSSSDTLKAKVLIQVPRSYYLTATPDRKLSPDELTRQLLHLREAAAERHFGGDRLREALHET